MSFLNFSEGSSLSDSKRYKFFSDNLLKTPLMKGLDNLILQKSFNSFHSIEKIINNLFSGKNIINCIFFILIYQE